MVLFSIGRWYYYNLFGLKNKIVSTFFQIYNFLLNKYLNKDLLQCSCNFSREKNSISSVFGEDLTTLSMFDSEFENQQQQVSYDSEEDQIIQYADSNAPLNYKEMPTSVCDSKK